MHGPERMRSTTAMTRVFQFQAITLRVPVTPMNGAHDNETRSDCRSLNAHSIDYMCKAGTCGAPERHALLLRQSLFGHFRDQSRLQVVQAATVERIYARCVMWQGTCVIHVGMAD